MNANHWAGNCPDCGAVGIGSKRLTNTLFMVKCAGGHKFLTDSYKGYTKPVEHQFNTMENIHYPDIVRQLAKDGREILDSCTPERMHLLHMAVGISGEVAELFEAMNKADKDFENILEECGDIEFYFEGYHQGVGLKIKYTSSPDIEGSYQRFLADLVIAAGDLLDATKKIVFYDQAPDINNITKCLAGIEQAKRGFYHSMGFNVNHAKSHNIKKLGKRYKDFNYSDKQAKERADKK